MPLLYYGYGGPNWLGTLHVGGRVRVLARETRVNAHVTLTNSRLTCITGAAVVESATHDDLRHAALVAVGWFSSRNGRLRTREACSSNRRRAIAPCNDVNQLLVGP